MRPKRRIQQADFNPTDRGAAPAGDDPRHAPAPAGLAVFGALTGISALAALFTGIRLAGSDVATHSTHFVPLRP